MTATTTAQLRRASTTAGVALLVLALMSAVGYLAGVQRLVVAGDAIRTATSIAGSATTFRLALACLLAVALLDIVAAWALYSVFEPVNEQLARLAAWCRVAYAVVFVVAIAQLVGILRVLPQPGDPIAPGLSAEILAHVNAYEDIWSLGLVVFGLHLMLLGLLARQASYAPTLLGVLLVVAGGGYAIDGFGVVLIPGYGSDVATYTFVGEVALIFWLLLRGRRVVPQQ